MNAKSFAIAIAIAIVSACAAIGAEAHEIDPGGKLELRCPQDQAPRRAQIARMLERSHYWAGQVTREHLYQLALGYCAAGYVGLRFVPTPEEQVPSVGAPQQVAAVKLETEY
jgi:hypothetical protein